jgi:DNA-binding winged helix-turn-helix (wHTH) protein
MVGAVATDENRRPRAPYNLMNVRISIGDLVFDATLRRLTSADGRVATLTPKAAALLRALVEASPEALSQQAIYDRLWPDTFVEPGNLHNLAAELRTAAGDPAFLRTLHRFGYALRDAVRQEPQARFALIAGELRIELGDGETILGRDVLPFADVSRRHARVVVGPDAVTIEDLGSKNGTFVNTRRVEGARQLSETDEVVVGRTKVRLVSAVGSTTVTASSPLSGSSGSGRDR